MFRRLALALCLAGARAGRSSAPAIHPPRSGPAAISTASSWCRRPGITGGSGAVELGHVAGPFTVAVTPDGRPRHRLILSVGRPPVPATLGRFRTYVAWVAPPAMHPMRRLGEVHDGRTDLGVVDLEKFVVLVTAEASARVRSRRPGGAAGPVAQHPALPAGPARVLHRQHGHRAERRPANIMANTPGDSGAACGGPRFRCHRGSPCCRRRWRCGRRCRLSLRRVPRRPPGRARLVAAPGRRHAAARGRPGARGPSRAGATRCTPSTASIPAR